jgi:uncharacterized membrane protein YgaE (UPF0421/DUF939 family)
LENQDIGGTLTLKIMLPPEAEELMIRRVTPRTQEIDLHNGARLTAELIETMGDKLTMTVQEITEQKTAKDDDNEIRQKINEALEEIESTKQNNKPDGKNPLINDSGLINDSYLSGAAKRYFITQAEFDAMHRPLTPGRYIITDGI